MESDVEDGYTTIKMTLNKFCFNKDIKVRINEFVLNANKLMFEAYAFANLHIINCIKQNKDIPLLDQTFFQKCCLLVSEQVYRKERKTQDTEQSLFMQETFNLYSQQRSNDYRPAFRDYNGALINYIKKDMCISTLNHLVLNFYSRMRIYLKHRCNLDNKTLYFILKNIYEKEYIRNDKNVGGNNNFNNSIDQLILYIRKQLDDLPPTMENIRKNPKGILILYNRILNYIIKHNLEKSDSEKALRLFSLLPHKNSFQISNITIDTTILNDIISSFNQTKLNEDLNIVCTEEKIINFIETKPKKTKKEKTSTVEVDQKTKPKRTRKIKTLDEKEISDKENKDIWKVFFNIKNIKNFALIIKTDGNSVSIMYKTMRILETKKKKNLKGASAIKDDYNLSGINVKDFDIIKAFDPGFRYMFTGTSSLKKTENDINKYSSKTYYHKCQINKSSQQQKIMYRKNEYLSEYFKNMPTNKTNNISKYLNRFFILYL